MDIEPRVTYEVGNGEANMHIDKKEPQRIDIYLYTQKRINERPIVERIVDRYGLYLAEEQVPFVPTHQSSTETASIEPGVRVIPENAAIRLGPFRTPLFEPRH
ncbi:MAG TPA: hypothetical protein VHL30_01445 [Chlamydiales bacterium]|nr:hypothetical protein [Chlamydiales bacterium]